MEDVRAVAYLLCWLMFAGLLMRLVFSWVAGVATRWTPRGAALVAAETVYSATDPLVKPLRKVLPKLTLGGLTIDLTLMVALGAVYLAMTLLR